MDLIFTSWKALLQYVTHVSELGHKCLKQKNKYGNKCMQYEIFSASFILALSLKLSSKDCNIWVIEIKFKFSGGKVV